MSARFEIVRTDAEQPWHARFRAANGRVVWSTENYRHRGGAIKAVNVIAGVAGAPRHARTSHVAGVRDVGHGLEVDFGAHGLIEVRDVDERPVTPLDLDDAEGLMRWAKRQSKVAREIRADRKIHAIKELRGLTGASLFQSKAAMDLAWAERTAQ